MKSVATLNSNHSSNLGSFFSGLTSVIDDAKAKFKKEKDAIGFELAMLSKKNNGGSEGEKAPKPQPRSKKGKKKRVATDISSDEA